MSVVKNRLKKDFSMIPNAIINDEAVSIEARFMYIYLASKPDEWVVQHEDIKRVLKIKSRTSMAKYALELINSGWASRTLRKGDGGSLNGGYDYELHADKIEPVKSIVLDNVRPKNEHGSCPENERTDVSKNGHRVCPNFVQSQKMDTNNTEIDRTRDYTSSNTFSVWETWQAILAMQVTNFTENELEALRGWAEFKKITDRHQINATISHLKQLQIRGGNVLDAITISTAGGFKGIIDNSPKFNNQPIKQPSIPHSHDGQNYDPNGFTKPYAEAQKAALSGGVK